ncbi:hypothetical protein [Vibrio superstes]|uniref:Transmembrane protein n=1 Tax=Vibrio superstes NBRC 103154 TaxID=1219062 RepID=A0A511QKJ4_9VIBR|nr:hypothetical protein [Vibrio superstes]GEM77853.1 hypothetical protein VSU01S_00980 [Vibrio superstes NBRC 103154]
MLRFFGAMFVAIVVLLSCSVGVYKAQDDTVNLYECANLQCRYTSEVLEGNYYIGFEDKGWVTLLMSGNQAVLSDELELQFMGFNPWVEGMNWVHWMLMLWVAYIAFTSAKYRMRYDILDVRFRMIQDELSDKLAELARYKGKQEF